MWLWSRFIFLVLMSVLYSLMLFSGLKTLLFSICFVMLGWDSMNPCLFCHPASCSIPPVRHHGRRLEVQEGPGTRSFLLCLLVSLLRWPSTQQWPCSVVVVLVSGYFYTPRTSPIVQGISLASWYPILWDPGPPHPIWWTSPPSFWVLIITSPSSQTTQPSTGSCLLHTLSGITTCVLFATAIP